MPARTARPTGNVADLDAVDCVEGISVEADFDFRRVGVHAVPDQFREPKNRLLGFGELSHQEMQI
jgi:hypothetical protein